MKLEVQFLHCADVLDLVSWKPEDPDDFYLFLEVSMGVVGEVGEEVFYFHVCSPGYLARNYAIDGYALGRHFVIMMRYNYDLLKQIMDGIAERASGSTWEEAIREIGKHGRWEADYESAQDYE